MRLRNAGNGLRCLLAVCSLAGVVTTLLATRSVPAATPLPSAARPVDYVRDIKPIFKKSCYACHGVLQSASGLRLDAGKLIHRGADSGAIITPGKADESELVQRVASRDASYQMPPEGELLKPEQIDLLKRWIEQGAKYPTDDKPEEDPKKHWAFQPIIKPPVPRVSGTQPANPIDAFLAAQWEPKKIVPQGPAEKRALLRRLYLDLIGLPPTAAEQAAFLSEASPDAYEKIVDKLLATPQYGERWGRHWMDIWRYSDWWGLGAEVRNSQKHIWHWRDWIVESLNADLGYDEMIRQMLAADELYPTDPSKIRATGFLVRNYFYFNRTTWLDSTVEHVSKGILGVTLNCTKCHDHKYDPFSQTEYYRLRAFFEPQQVRMDQLPGEPDLEKDGLPRAYDCDLALPTYKHIRGEDTNPDKAHPLAPGVPKLLSLGELKIDPIKLPLSAYAPGLVQEFILKDFLHDAEQTGTAAREELDKARGQLKTLEQEAGKPVSAGPSPIIVEPAPQVSDNLNSQVEIRWLPVFGVWHTRSGIPLQQVSGERSVLRLRQSAPRDFQARLRVRGIADKSKKGADAFPAVGMSFDVGSRREVTVLLEPQEKRTQVRLSYRENGETISFPAVADAEPIPLARPHQLVVRVRGSLVNVAVDWDWVLAFRLPGERTNSPGSIDLVTEGGAAEFQKFDLWPLTNDVELAEQLPLPTRVGEGQIALLTKRTAEKTLARVQLQPAWGQACLAADRARFAEEKPTADVDQKITAAALVEKQMAVARAEEDFAREVLKAAQLPIGKKFAAEEALVKLTEKLRQTRADAKKPSKVYTSLRGSKKIKGHNTETDETTAKPFPTTSTGRRAALAKWITDPRLPLPARVAVNHIWSRHFGKPIVPSMFDFGRRAPRPALQPVLDYLAQELIDGGWKMKRIHRLLVTSEAYRRASSNRGASPVSLAADPENVLVWRMNPIRMEAQVVRDSLLQLAGTLDPTLGGPTIPVSQEDSKRRSLYFFHSFNEQQRFLSMFDDASVLECYRRDESVIPQQALALSNSKVALESAQRVAAQLESGTKVKGEVEFIRAAFELILACDPNPDELVACHDTLHEWAELYKKHKQADPAKRARVMLVHALLNHNDFVTVR